VTNAVEIVSTPIRDNEPAADPFSSDIFGSNNKTTAPEPPGGIADSEKLYLERELQRPASWAAHLPRISRRLLESGFDEKLPTQLPDTLSKAIEEALGDVVFVGSGRVRCTLESIAECDLFADSTASGRAGNLAVQIVFEPTQSYAVVMIGGSFVHRIIDGIFGPSGYESSNRISPIEMAIAEFLAARAVARINDSLGNDFFSVGETSLMPTEFFKELEVGAKARIEVQTDSALQLFQVLMSRGFLSGLKKAGSIFDSDSDELGAAKLFRTVRAVPLRAQIGSTRLDAATLSFLEPGDVVIVEESQLNFHHGSPRGELRLLAGAGNNFVLTGELSTELGAMNILLKDILSREAVINNYTARSIMEDKKSGEVEWEEGNGAEVNAAAVERQEGNEISASVENLQLRLRVELAGKKMSLREINDLRVGQVIDLGRGPTDSVNLVADGSDETVAAGELVDIEGRLGVRLTKVFI
jgi:flagellar motor switch/type III secretory pathway protein FliN